MMLHNVFGDGVTDAYATAGWRLKACDQMEKRTLAATGGTDDGDELAGSNSEIQMSNGFNDYTAARSIPFDEISDFYARTAHVNGRQSGLPIGPVNRSRFTRRSPGRNVP